MKKCWLLIKTYDKFIKKKKASISGESKKIRLVNRNVKGVIEYDYFITGNDECSS